MKNIAPNDADVVEAEAEAEGFAPGAVAGWALERMSKMSIVLERRREYCRGVRSGERMVVWSGLFWESRC
jgi:hypothetical protein